MTRRAIVIVLDGCGAGATLDAADFGDSHGPSTLRHVWDSVGGFNAPTLERLGFLAAGGIGVASQGRFGRLNPLGRGKDSVTGHWEMMGAVVTEAFPTYPDGFPIPLVKEFERAIGVQTIGNRPASGTKILDDLGELHVDTGFPILYTSADSVFQLAAHEEVVPIETLYSWCETARRLCVKPNNVQRVIARPFLGKPGEWKRTERRRDFPIEPPQNLVDKLAPVYGVGVVPQLFGERGFLTVQRTQNNREHMSAMEDAMASGAPFIFANFEDFDMLYGHRNDPAGFATSLEEFDVWLGGFVERLAEDDLLILTADHGNDPTDPSTDHTREFSPLAITGPRVEAKSLGDQESLACVGATVAATSGSNGLWELT